MQNLSGTRKNSLLELITVVKGSEASSTSTGSHTECWDLHHSNPVQHRKLLWHLLSLIHKATTKLARQPLDFLGSWWTKTEGESSMTKQVNTTGVFTLIIIKSEIKFKGYTKSTPDLKGLSCGYLWFAIQAENKNSNMPINLLKSEYITRANSFMGIF